MFWDRISSLYDQFDLDFIFRVMDILESRYI